MSNITEAVDSIRTAARQYKGFVAAADLLESYGSIDNAIKEAQAALKIAQKERAEGDAELKKVKDSIKDATAKHKEMLEHTGAEATRLVEDAKGSAFNMSVQAKSEADAIVEAAKTQALAEKNAYADDVLTLKSTKAKLNDEVQTLKTRIDGMEAEADAAEKRLNKIKADVAKLAAA